MTFKIAICILFLAVINLTDIKGYKIKNKVVLPTVLIGLIYGLVCNSFLDSVYGMLIPLVLFPLYALRMLGAGDIKAFCAIGALLGFRISVTAMLFSFLAGGVIGAGFLLLHKNFVERFRNLFRYLKLCFTARKVFTYDFGGGAGSYFRFSYAITAGTILAVVNDFLCFI